jgi:ATP-dependent DNA ligase
MPLPLSPPINPMLARLQTTVPRGPEWVYEPKWDGFRAIVFRDGDDIHIASRDHKPLERYFPELPPALGGALAERCVVDGEIVVGHPGGLDFDALLQRIHPARSRIERLAHETPATFVAFDLLARDERDIRKVPLEQRRAGLEDMLGPQAEPRAPAARATQVLLTPQTADVTEALHWMRSLEDIGLDGVVAKRRSSPYVAGERTMVKVKLQRTADCVVGGYRLSKARDGVASLLLGLYDSSGVLHYVGHSSSFRAAEKRELLALLRDLDKGPSFGDGRSPGGPSRWAHGREDQWFPVAPALVCEVAFDRLMSGRFRHASRLLRWRPERRAQDCTFEQLEWGRG